MKFISFTASLIFLTLFVAASGQTTDVRGRNNPFSPSPKPKVRGEVQPERAMVTASDAAAETDPRPTVAQRTFSSAKTVRIRPASPVEVYKVDIGDILFINLQNAPKASGYFTVRIDGTIDFPLAGENVNVAGQTTQEIETALVGAVKLYSDPRIEVKVREFASHKINISGLVDRPGEISIQREAIPLYIVRAGVLVDQAATKVLIRRSRTLKVETYDLRESNTESVLVYPGDAIEFSAGVPIVAIGAGEFFYIGGGITSGGQKPLTPGMTLSQAILASGGPKGSAKKAVIRKKNDNGTLVFAEHNLKAIREGKALDPVLSPGDLIEIEK